MKNKWTRLAGVSLVAMLIAFIAATGCGKKDQPGANTQPAAQAPSEVIKCRVAVLVPETGNLAFMGVPIRNALELALAKNEGELRKSGIQIELVSADSKGNPKEAVTSINRAIDIDGANVVLTFLSGVTAAVGPIVGQKDALLLGLTVDPTFLKDCPGKGIRVMFSYKHQAEVFAEQCNRRKWNKVLVIHGTDQSSTYGIQSVFAPLMQQAGKTLVFDTYTLGQRDFKTTVAKHANFDGQAIIIDAFGAEFPLLVAQIKSTPALAGLPIFGSLGAVEVKHEQRQMMAGVEFLAPRFVIKDPDQLYSTLESEYKAKYPNAAFSFTSVYAYDAFDLLVHALRKGKSIRGTDLFNALQGKSITTTSDTYRFDPSGDFSPAMSIGRYDEKGAIVFVEDVE